MLIEINSQSVSSFNQKGEALLMLLHAVDGPPPGSRFPSERVSSPPIDRNQIKGGVEHSEIDFKGNEVGKYFDVDGTFVGLKGSEYYHFDQLCRSIQRVPSIRNTISLRLVKESVFKWLKSRHTGQAAIPVTEFILPLFGEMTRDLEIWVPIYGTEIESEISVGRIRFVPLNKSVFDRWQAVVSQQVPAGRMENVLEWLEKERAEVQGFAAATIRLCAEPKRAIEIAFEETEKSLCVLRFFEPTNFHPDLVSHCTILGEQHLLTVKAYHIEEGMIKSTTDAIAEKWFRHWQIDNRQIERMYQDGLARMNQILLNEQSSVFQCQILEALQTYSRVGLAKTYADKLVYLLVTLESLLLKDPSEAIAQNVGERLAFALERTPEARKAVYKNFKDVYTLRSDFIHHGNYVEPERVELLAAFMLNAWRFLLMVIHNSENFATKGEMIAAIESIKFK